MSRKEIKNSILMFFLAVSIIVGMVGSFLLVRISQKQADDNISLILTERVDDINQEFSDAINAVNVMTRGMTVSLADPSIILNPEFEQEFSERYRALYKSILADSNTILSGYMRYNPKILGGRTGFFIIKNGGEIVDILPTDMSKYDENDLEHVGWYYLPVAFGSAIWTEPYRDESTGKYMISYASPIVSGDTVVGVVGADIEMTKLLTMVDEMKIYDTGYALLYDKSGNIINSYPETDIKSPITRSMQLENGMTLEICAPEKEVYILRKSMVFYFIMGAYVLMLLILLSTQLAKIVRKDYEKEVHSNNVDKHERLVNLLHLLSIIAVLLIQIGFLGYKYLEKNNILTKSFEANNEYANTLRVYGFENFFPYSYESKDGRILGAEVEAVNEIANRMSMNVDITLKRNERTIDALLSGEADVIIGSDEICKNDEYAQLVKSDILMKDSIVVYGKENVNSVNDIYGKRVGRVDDISVLDIYGFTEGGKAYGSYTSALDSVVNDENDYVVLRRNAAQYFSRDKKYADLKEVYEVSQSSLVIVTRPENEELLQRINEAILSMTEDKSLNEIKQRWFELSIYDLSMWNIIKEEKGFFEFTFVAIALLLVAYLFSSALHRKNREIRNEQNHSRELQRISDVDELTGLFNRRHYELTVKELRERTSFKDITIVAMDVNGLKETNDSLGHAAGDTLLKTAATCIKNTFSLYGDCFRIGGDEFMVVAVGEIPQHDALSAMFKRSIEEAQNESGINLSISFGIVYGGDYYNVTMDELISAADQLMYADKMAYYQQKGIDRRGQQAAYGAICESYAKILKVNLTTDTYSIIQVDIDEMTQKKGFDDRISVWMHDFATSGQVAKEDVENYLSKTNIEYLRAFFKKEKGEFCIQYGRKTGDTFAQAMMEMVQAPDYTDENQLVYLFVKNIASHGENVARHSSNSELERELQRRAHIESVIHEALHNEYFFMMYQPQYYIKDHSLRGYEALIRLRLPDGTFMSPGEFIPLAESTGLIVEIDNYVLEHSMAQFVTKLSSDKKVLVSVNISARTISDAGFVKKVMDCITKTGFDPKALELEITEYSFADDNKQTIENILELREKGINIALDDFGTGYTSLSQLIQIPFDLLKIDKSLVDDIEKDKVKRDFVKSVIELGHLVESEVIAEGVEKDEQIDILKERGCDFVQGYLWGRPMNFDDL